MTPSLLAYAPIILRAAGLTIWLSWLALLIGAVGGLALAADAHQPIYATAADCPAVH